MKKIQFDCGVKQYHLNGGVLRFNPGDPNVYARFLQMGEKLEALEQKLSRRAKELPEDAAGKQLLELVTQADQEAKQLLAWVFGPGNDFDRLLEGVNLMAVGENGKQVMENLMDALEPILLEGAKKYTQDTVHAAQMQARQRRGQTL